MKNLLIDIMNAPPKHLHPATGWKRNRNKPKYKTTFNDAIARLDKAIEARHQLINS